ncbi:hypothetical protein CR513_55344, partial [Mucuna pruriens]
MATPLLPLSYDGNPNRPPYPTEFALKLEPRGAIKTQALADFLVEMTSPLAEDTWWVLYVDDFSNPKGGGVDIILEGPRDVTLEHSLKLDFKASNN